MLLDTVLGVVSSEEEERRKSCRSNLRTVAVEGYIVHSHLQHSSRTVYSQACCESAFSVYQLLRNCIQITYMSNLIGD